MKKRLFIYISTFIVGMLLIGFGHIKFFTFTDSFKDFLIASYIYLICATLAVCFLLAFLQNKKRFKHQIGYFYLFSVPLKIIIFIIIFQKQFSDQSSTSKQELTNCLFIMVLTLFFEVLFITKLLNISRATKNVE